VISARS